MLPYAESALATRRAGKARASAWFSMRYEVWYRYGTLPLTCSYPLSPPLPCQIRLYIIQISM